MSATLWACPSCRQRLVFEPPVGWRCGACGTDHPELDGIPWLLPDPASTLAEWTLRLKHLAQRMDMDAESLKAELRDPTGMSELTLKRLRKLLQAKVEHRKAVTELLAPLEASEAGSAALSKAMRTKVPAGQTLTSYYANLHRDWAWETEENAACLAAVEAALGETRPLGTLLALGAGACRLPYDLHLKRRPERTIACDINPLMLLAAKRILKGKTVKLYEFPIAPKDLDSHAVLRKCVAPVTPVADFELVFADALTPPFADGTFDTVLTPWLVDIVPEDLGELAATIGRLLKPGGIWVEFGSLAFNHGRQARNYSYEEALEVVAKNGFTVETVRRDTVPYMQSPASHHGRVETTVTWVAKRTGEPPARKAPYSYLPDWLANPGMPVPRLRAFEQAIAVQIIYLEALALIDGKRTLAEMAVLFGQKHGMPPAEALGSLKNFLTRHWEESLVGMQH